ncbi:MAG: ATP-dependent sacrificial sulfur transferase LarE [Lachnospiraceae bacterium]|nr:ATP-dependent sacrificial sulfur transferase LarE [Lachnospiraceae bacterium]
MTIKEFFEKNNKVAIAFSGGVDSAYLLYAALQYAKEVSAYYVKTTFQPQFEFDDAMRLADELKADVSVIRLDVLKDCTVTANPANRCYYCKQNIFGSILESAKADGFTTLLDGTNASDDAGDRPGMKALEEMHVLSPLRLCGLTKDEIRRRSKEAGLFTWDKPAYACLATRIPTGQAITAEALRRTELAEDYMFSLGFTDFRVRTIGNTAKIQVTAKDFPLAITHKEKLVEELKKYYSSVCLDLEVRP